MQHKTDATTVRTVRLVALLPLALLAAAAYAVVVYYDVGGWVLSTTLLVVAYGLMLIGRRKLVRREKAADADDLAELRERLHRLTK
jgi:hypothetical protein